MNRIFLGGTCAGTTWRNELIEYLHHNNYDCEWFNPVVENWTIKCQEIEEDEKNNKCNIHLYVITPEMEGFYSIAEIVNSCWQAQMYGTKVNKVALFVMGEWTEKQKKSFKAVMRLCRDIAPFKFECDFISKTYDIVDLLESWKFIYQN